MKNLIYILLLIPMSIFAQDSHTAQRTYEYDNLNRLVKVVFTNGETYEYQYDNLGNRTLLTAVTDVELTYVPDDNFEQALIDLGYDSGALDDYVLTHNIDEITELEIYGKNIEDLTGIEDFELLENLDISSNLLISLDISQNTNLKSLNCHDNLLSNINISQNSALESLEIAHNQLTELNTTSNTNLEFLSCDHNNLSSLDVTQNTLLKNLDFQYNNLTSIDIQQNILLENFNAQDNLLSEINFSQNPLLETIIIPINNLSTLDVTNQSQLTELWCHKNNISEIDLSNNSLLQTLYIYDNQLSELGVEQNVNLYNLSCYNNNLTNIYFGNNYLLEEVHCGNNNITNIDVSNLNMLRIFGITNNQLTSLDLHLNPLIFRLWCFDNDLTFLNVKNGNNQGILTMSSQNNPNLTCIQVDNEVDANSSIGVYADWQKDTFVSYSEACDVPLTYVPDDNFEQALIDLGYDSGALDDYVLTHNIDGITDLNINNKNISDLTGIEDFTALRFLSCQNNQIQEIDISDNLNLISLDIWNNQLTSLDVSNNSQLISLSVFQNQLTNIDVTNNTSLKYLEYANNQISNIDLTQNTVLELLDCENNQISNINISENILLKDLFCGNNLLTNIDVSAQTNLEGLVIENNQITSLDISNNPLIIYLNADNNQLTNFNVYQNNNLEVLSFDYNEVTSFDATQIPQIIRLHCQNNLLTDLDISTNIYLQRLICRENQLESLNLKNGHNATVLGKVDSSSNPNLTCIQVDNENDANNQPCTSSPYTGWCKDTDAFYSEDCRQSSTIELPYDNYAVDTIGLTCINSNDGVIHILANLERIYNIDIVSTENNYHENFVLNGYQYWDIFIEYLKGGEYTVTITLDGISYDDYHKTFILNIDEPEPLQAVRMENGTTQTVTMTGTAPFFISLNDVLIAETNEAEYTFEAKNGDELEIKTSNSCEGKYSEIINISEVVIIYPNPTNDRLNFMANSFVNGDIIEIKLVDINGRLVEVFTSGISNSKASISVEHLASGIYFVKFPSLNNQTFKIIKE